MLSAATCEGMRLISPYMEKPLTEMNIREIALLIQDDWKKVNYAAKPYLQAMMSMKQVNDNCHTDKGEAIILYFLSNASGWRGEVAKPVKAELKARLKAVGVKI